MKQILNKLYQYVTAIQILGVIIGGTIVAISFHSIVWNAQAPETLLGILCAIGILTMILLVLVLKFATTTFSVASSKADKR